MCQARGLCVLCALCAKNQGFTMGGPDWATPLVLSLSKDVVCGATCFDRLSMSGGWLRMSGSVLWAYNPFVVRRA